MGNTGEALYCGNSYCRRTPVSQRADQARRLSPLCCCCNLSSALRVRHLCQAQLFSWAGAGADWRAFQPERNSLLITAQAMLQESSHQCFMALQCELLKSWGRTRWGKRIRVNLGNRMQSAKSALSKHFWHIFFRNLLNLTLKRSGPTRDSLHSEVGILQIVYLFHLSLWKPTDILTNALLCVRKLSKGSAMLPSFQRFKPNCCSYGKRKLDKPPEQSRVHTRQKVLHVICSSQREWVVMSKIELQIFSSFLLPTGTGTAFLLFLCCVEPVVSPCLPG